MGPVSVRGELSVVSPSERTSKFSFTAKLRQIWPLSNPNFWFCKVLSVGRERALIKASERSRSPNFRAPRPTQIEMVNAEPAILGARLAPPLHPSHPQLSIIKIRLSAARQMLFEFHYRILKVPFPVT